MTRRRRRSWCRATRAVSSRHGPRYVRLAHGQPDQLLQKTGILNAYYLPVRTRGVVSATLVNSFRVVFNTYFGASLPLLGPDLRHVSDQQAFHVRRHHRSAGGGAAGLRTGMSGLSPLGNDAIGTEDAEE